MSQVIYKAPGFKADEDALTKDFPNLSEKLGLLKEQLIKSTLNEAHKNPEAPEKNIMLALKNLIKVDPIARKYNTAQSMAMQNAIFHLTSANCHMRKLFHVVMEIEKSLNQTRLPHIRLLFEQLALTVNINTKVVQNTGDVLKAYLPSSVGFQDHEVMARKILDMESWFQMTDILGETEVEEELEMPIETYAKNSQAKITALKNHLKALSKN
jgi:hypothetical protein